MPANNVESAIVSFFYVHEFVIEPDHPALPGHFPGHPIVPGVLILQEVVERLSLAAGGRQVGEIVQVKFLSLLLPGQCCRIYLDSGQGERVRFECRVDDRVIGSGVALMRRDA